MKKYAVDFDVKNHFKDGRISSTSIDDWVIRDIDSINDITIGSGIESLLNVIENDKKSSKYYFYDLSFSIYFFMDYINENYTYIEDVKSLRIKKTKNYSLIADQGKFYKVMLFDGKHTHNFFDTKCKLNLSIGKLAKAYGIDVVGNTKTEKVTYILAKCLKMHFDIGDIKITSSSDALEAYKRILGGQRKFRMAFPILSKDKDTYVRDSIFGAWLYCNKKETGEGFSMDRNSQYAYIMSHMTMPYGQPKIYKGQIRNVNANNCYFVNIKVSGKLKSKHFPFIPNLYEQPDELGNDYSKELIDRTLVLALPDYIMLMKNYNITSIEYISYYEFRGSKDLFKEYVKKYGDMKEKASADGNMGLRQIAKLKLNGLYGKFIQKPRNGEDPIYAPTGAYVLAISRMLMLNGAQLYPDKFIYCDTDSLHFEGCIKNYTFPKNIAVFDDYKIGGFKIEFEFTRSKHIWVKEYILENGKKRKTALSGVMKEAQDDIPYDEFEHGHVVKHASIVPVKIPGGIVRVYRDFVM